MTAQVEPKARANRRALFGWVMFDWAGQPFFTLVLTFVFAPYFASAVAATPAEGQSLWGYATAAAGLIIAVLAPVLGSVADAAGGRKYWIAAFSAPFAVGSMALWLAAPGESAVIPLVLGAFVVATVGIEFAGVFNNAMMPGLVRPEKLGRLSGYGWALGYVGGLVSLVIVLGLLAANPQTDLTLLGMEPLFGLDPALREGDRIAGPFAAVWYLIFVLPLFLWTPDQRRKAPLASAIRSGLGSLLATVAQLRARRSIAMFLLANMIYKDGLAALFAFGGIYAAGQLGWGPIQIGVFGILLTITGAFGAVIGGRLDDLYGPRAVIGGALCVLIICGFGLVSVDRNTIFFVISTPPATSGGAMFSTPPEQIFLALGGCIGAVSGPLQSASRTLLVRLAPLHEITQYFGLFALSGKITSFFAPFMVALVTAVTASQATGMAVILGFFILGLAILMRVELRAER